MTRPDDSVQALDLLAAADGRLDRARRERVDEYLAANPADAARVAAWRRQNEVIARAYAPVLDEPVPERLLSVLAAENGRTWTPAVRAAVVAGLVLCAGLAGWSIGREGGGFDPRAFVQQGVAHFAADADLDRAGTAGAPLETPAAVVDAGVGWLSDGISLRLTAPDLSAQGYHVLEKRRLVMEGRDVVRILYADAQGDQVALFLRPRWREDAPDVGWGRSHGLSFAYWLDGPLVYGVAGAIDRDALSELVERIRDTTTERAPTAPRLEPDAGPEAAAALPAVQVPAVRTN